MIIYRSEKISDNLYAINEVDSVTVYLLVGNTKAILIDTGYGYGDLLAEIRKITTLPIEVYCTHGHIDHVLGNYLFDQVHLNERDYPIMFKHISDEREMNLEYRYRKLPDMRDLVDKEDYLARDFSKVKLLPLDERTVIPMDGLELEVMFFPGHSKGSVIFIDKSNKRIFTGDSISIHNIWMFQEDSLSMRDYLASLNKLDDYLKEKGDLDQWQFYPAHETYPLGYEVLKNLISCAEQILADSSEEDESFEFFDAKGLKHYYKNVSIVYTKDRI